MPEQAAAERVCSTVAYAKLSKPEMQNAARNGIVGVLDWFG